MTTGIPSRNRPKEGNIGDLLTLPQVLDLLEIKRSTFYDWRAKRKAPRCHRLPNGEIRIKRADFDLWLDSLQEAA